MVLTSGAIPRKKRIYPSEKVNNLILVLLGVVFVAFLARTAWMSDDSYITLRTVDNFIHGQGLTWNPPDRVQAYTHPLWMLVLSVAYFLTREAYYTTLFLSALLSIATVLLVAWKLASSRAAGILALVSLILSKAFLDYSTSGLENPLTHLLLAAFLLVYLRPGSMSGWRRLFHLGLLSSLIAINRSDAVLLVLPALLLAWLESGATWRERLGKGLGILALAYVPLLLWEGFALFYYGFPVPNTFYAKLDTGISQIVLVQHGITYLLASASIDPLTPLIIAGALALTIWRRDKSQFAVAAGIGLYLLYILRIGGDFMAGRFLAAPLLCAVVLCCVQQINHTLKLALPLVLILLVGLAGPRSVLRGQAANQCDIPFPVPQDAADERACYFEGTGLIHQKQDSDTRPSHPLAEYGLEARSGLSPIRILGAVGMYGFYAGIERYILDLNALGDPLLARVPVPQGKPWRIGHFERLIPAGYLESIASGQDKICDSNLAQYYGRLALILRGPLFSPERLATIVRMNTGQYDSLLKAYDATNNAADQLCNAQSKVDVAFAGTPRLRGYSISSDHAHPGEVVQVTLYWQGRPDPGLEPASFVHIRNNKSGMQENPRTQSDIWAQDEHAEPGGRGPDSYWPAQVYTDMFYLQLPQDMPAGEYMIEIGWFSPKTGEQIEPQPDTVKSPLAINWRSIKLPPLRVE